MTARATTLAAILGLGPGLASAEVARPAPDEFTVRVVATGLEQPFELTWDPDGYFWVTERSGKRVTRVRPSDGAKEVALTLPEVRGTEGEQDGLLGLALHPGLLKDRGHDHVYVAYTYDAGSDPQAPQHRVRIRRYTYDRAKRTLGAPLDLLTGLPSSPDHNAGRLVFGPDGRLFYAIGDQGANQFAGYCVPNRAQELPTAAELEARDWTKYAGKVLRLELDGSVPPDNPVLDGVRSHVYAYGFRNPQGLAFAPDGRLFGTDHGPKSDDEVNRVEAGGNYGWPFVAGYQDDKAYVYEDWSASKGVPCASLKYSSYAIPPSVPQKRESAWRHPDFRPPLRTFFTVPDTFDFRDAACSKHGVPLLCWPTIAPSSVEVYVSRAGGPAWGESLLITSLKNGAVYRVPLTADGAAGEPAVLFHTTNRYRDLALSPGGRAIYILTDSGGTTRSPSGGATSVLRDRGAILEFRHR